MSVREIPKQTEYGCDLCGKKYTQQSSIILPQYWASLVLHKDMSPPIDKLLCDTCTPVVEQAIHQAFERLKP